MASEKVERLRAEILVSESGYAEIGRECGVSGNYIRKFATGALEEPTVSRYEALLAAMAKVRRRAKKAAQGDSQAR
jgi:hypothetical protein